MSRMATTTLQEIDKLANLYNKTKDDKYKILWYKKVKELANGRTSTLSSSITSKVRWDNVKRGARIYKTNDST
jgi:hypothetical protein